MKDYRLLAFADAPLATCGRGTSFTADPVQRAGVAPPWSDLACVDVLAPGPDEAIAASLEGLGGVHGPAAHWLCEPVGGERVSDTPAAQPATHLFLALTNPVPGEDEAFNRWYDTVHLPEVLNYIPEFASARRYRLLADWSRRAEWRYLAAYMLSTPDVSAMLAAMPARAAHFSPLQSIADGHSAWIWAIRGRD